MRSDTPGTTRKDKRRTSGKARQGKATRTPMVSRPAWSFPLGYERGERMPRLGEVQSHHVCGAGENHASTMKMGSQTARMHPTLTPTEPATRAAAASSTSSAKPEASAELRDQPSRTRALLSSYAPFSWVRRDVWTSPINEPHQRAVPPSRREHLGKPSERECLIHP